MTQKQQRPGGNQGAKQNKQHSNSNSSAAQRNRLIDGLRLAKSNGLTTVQIRRDLDIMEVHARLHELRWGEGYNIQSVWCVDTTESGREHRVCRYYLMPGSWMGEAA